MFEQPPRWWIYPFRVVLTVGLVTVGWVFFRAANFSDSRYVIAQMFSHAPEVNKIVIAPWLVWLAVMSLGVAILEESWDLFERLVKGPAWAYAAAMIILLFVVELIGVTDKRIPFVYFQF